MQPYSSKILWLAPLGQTVYESLNPYWFYCATSGRTPDQIALFHSIDMEDQSSKTVKAFSIVSRQYSGNAQLDIKCISFDDEDVQAFSEKVRSVFQEAAEREMKLIIDISPTTWSFVPVYLMEMAREHRKFVENVIYFQYSDHQSRHMPYALIPRLGITFHDLLREFNSSDG